MRSFQLLLILLIFCIPNADAQEVTKNFSELEYLSTGNTNATGISTITADPRIENLVLRHIAINMKQKGISGYRVQIFMGSGREAAKNAQTIKNQFATNFPEIDVYLDYQAPYFRVKAGNFRKTDKHLAVKLKKEVSAMFPSSWVIDDLIDYQKL